MTAIPKAIQDKLNTAKGQLDQASAQPQAEPTPQPSQQATPQPEVQGQELGQATPSPQQQQQPTPVSQGLGGRQRLNASTETATDWEQKYKVINGKYVNESKRDREKIKELEQQLEQAQKSQNVATPTNELTDDRIKELISPDLIEDYGIEYWRNSLTASQKVAMNAIPDQSSSTSKDVEEVKAQLRKREEDDFYDKLDQRFPQWEQVNKSEDFQSFLDTKNALTGQRYGDLMMQAVETFDVERVMNVFSEFDKLMQSGGMKAQPANPALQAQVVPNGSAGGGTAGSKQGQYPMSQWLADYRDLSKRGLSATQLQVEQQKLNDDRVNGKVYDDTAGGNTGGNMAFG